VHQPDGSEISCNHGIDAGLPAATPLVWTGKVTASDAHNVYLSGRNIPDVRVMRFADATAYEILWAQTVVVEIGALDEGPAKQETKEASDA